MGERRVCGVTSHCSGPLSNLNKSLDEFDAAQLCVAPLGCPLHSFGLGDTKRWPMRAIVSLTLGAVCACSVIYSLMTGRLPRKRYVRNLDGELVWAAVYRSELPRWYWAGVICYGVSACLLFVFAFIPWSVVKSLQTAVPKVFPWFLLFAGVLCVYQMMRALVSGKVKVGRVPRMGIDSWSSDVYRSDFPIVYWIFVVAMGFFAIITALGWWFMPRT
ncbi:MAG TPA: hypothetical protein VL282_09235 [Tepidisphaeraceae bacterium]|nr:hypothetical protein [Tepidisphaeraceae bacterium]